MLDCEQYLVHEIDYQEGSALNMKVKKFLS